MAWKSFRSARYESESQYSLLADSEDPNCQSYLKMFGVQICSNPLLGALIESIDESAEEVSRRILPLLRVKGYLGRQAALGFTDTVQLDGSVVHRRYELATMWVERGHQLRTHPASPLYQPPHLSHNQREAYCPLVDSLAAEATHALLDAHGQLINNLSESYQVGANSNGQYLIKPN